MEMAEFFNRPELERMAGYVSDKLEDVGEGPLFNACTTHLTLSGNDETGDLYGQSRRLTSVTRANFLSVEDPLVDDFVLDNSYREGCSPCAQGCIDHLTQVRHRSNSETLFSLVNTKTDRIENKVKYEKQDICNCKAAHSDEVFDTDDCVPNSLDAALAANVEITSMALDINANTSHSYRDGCPPCPQGGIGQPPEVRAQSNLETHLETHSDAFVEQVHARDAPCLLVTCNKCGINATETKEAWTNLLAHPGNHYNVAVGNDGDDHLPNLKLLAKMQEGGLNVEYRCPRCRKCPDCQNAVDTEKVSLREEAEDQAIKDSVKINWKDKKITCKLPLRGKEEDFLTGNRDIALKVLNQQCLKYHKDEETKNIVVKAFTKLFENGYASRFSELPQATKDKISNKLIQNYIPWRVVFKNSLSTPCRPVMDASSKTRYSSNGKGGRCLTTSIYDKRT